MKSDEIVIELGLVSEKTLGLEGIWCEGPNLEEQAEEFDPNGQAC